MRGPSWAESIPCARRTTGVEHYQPLGFVIQYHHPSYAAAHMTSEIYIHVDDADDLANDWRTAAWMLSASKIGTTESAKVPASTRTATSSASLWTR